MNFEDIDVEWREFSDQEDEGVTYVYVSGHPVLRLRGTSDILYIGQTTGRISQRVQQQTTTPPQEGGGGTNSRLTYVFNELRGWRCFYVDGQRWPMSPADRREFNRLMDIFTARGRGARLTFEKYLLVLYFEEHLELPPLNNAF